MKQKYTFGLFVMMLITAFLMLPNVSTFAQNASTDYAHKFFVGKINGRWKVRMVLNKRKRGKTEKGNLSGYYYYANTKGYIQLSGTWKANGSVLAEEKVMQKGKFVKTGAMAGRFDPATGKLMGTWTSADGKKSYSLELKETYRQGSLAADMVYFDEVNVYGKDSPRGVSMTFLYPRFKGGKVATTINQFIKERLLKNPEERIKKFIKQYQEYQKTNGQSSIYFNEDNYITIETNEKNILTISNNQYGFTGGAHGYYNSSYYSFDLRTGKLINIKELLYPGGEEAVKSLITQQIRKDAQLKPDEPLTKIGIYKKVPPIAANSYFRPDGIAFYYNVYEIGPYVIGPRLTVIPFNKIKRYMKRNNTVRKYMR